MLTIAGALNRLQLDVLDKGFMTLANFSVQNPLAQLSYFVLMKDRHQPASGEAFCDCSVFRFWHRRVLVHIFGISRPIYSHFSSLSVQFLLPPSATCRRRRRFKRPHRRQTSTGFGAVAPRRVPRRSVAAVDLRPKSRTTEEWVEWRWRPVLTG